MNIKRLDWAALLAILLLAAVLRLGWVGVNSYAFDEARLSLIALDMAQNGGLATLGMPSSAGIPNLPAAAWIFAIPYWFSTDPLVATWFVGVLNLLVVAGVWWLARRQWGSWAGLSAALFMAASPYSVLFSRNIWSQNLLPLLGFLWLWTAYLAASSTGRRTRFISIAAHVFLAGFAFQVHFAGAALALGTAYIGVRRRWWRQIAPVLTGGALAVLALLPSVLHIICCRQDVIAQFSAIVGGASRIDLASVTETLRLSTGLGWTNLVLGDEIDLFNQGIATGILAGGVLLLGLAALWHKRESAPGSEPARLPELLLVGLMTAPLFFIRHSTPVYVHYLLSGLPALALLAGAGTQLISSRWWPRVMSGLILVTAATWTVQVGQSLDLAGRLPTPNGLGTPLGMSRAAAYGVPGDKPALFFGHGDDPNLYGEAAIFSTFWWDRPHRIVNGETTLILPAEPVYLMATLAPIQAWEELAASGLAQDVQTFDRREGQFPFVMTAYDGQALPEGFTALPAPIEFDDGTQLVGWRVRWVGPRLRVSSLWQVIEPAPPGGLQQFHHLRTADTLDAGSAPFLVSDVPTSSRIWQAGDRVIIMGDFFVERDSPDEFWVDVGHYALEDLTRRQRADGQGDLVRLGPFRVTNLPDQYG